MYFKPTHSHKRAGFTLVEILITTVLGSLIFSAVGTLMLYTGRSITGIVNYVDLDDNSRHALDNMTRDIRQVLFLDSFTSNKLDFTDSDSGKLSFTYDPDKRTLTRTKGSEDTVLLTECDSLEFRVWQRNPIPGTFDLVATTNAELGKAIDVTWVCSRTILGSKMNTESVQTARIVIRKQQD